MNVLHLYSGNLYGGVETFLVTLARYAHLIPELKHHFALCFEGRLEQELRAAGAEVTRFHPVRFRKPLSVLRARRSLKRLLHEGEFDVVICHLTWSQALFGSIVQRSSIPGVFFLHGAVDEKQWTDRWARRVVPELMIAVSKYALQSGRWLYPHVRAEVLYLPMPWNMRVKQSDTRTGAIREEFNVQSSKLVITQISRMERLKGQDLLLRALHSIADLDEWTCWIVGGAQRAHEVVYRAELEQLAGELGLSERVRFVGERNDVPQILADTDLYCQPNRGPEGFGLTFVEAFAAGCPVITTDIGAAPEVIDPSAGILVPPDDIPALAGALRRLILNSDLRHRLSESARPRAVDLCDRQTRIQELFDFLKSVVKSGENSRQ